MKLLLAVTLLSAAACAQHQPLRAVPVTPPGSTAAIQPVSAQMSSEDRLRLMNTALQRQNAELQQLLLQSTVCASLGLMPSCSFNVDSGQANGLPAVQVKK